MTLKTISVAAMGLGLLVYIGCVTGTNNPEGEPKEALAEQPVSEVDMQKAPLETCYVCHNPLAPSHDAIIAPPLAAVKLRYQRMYPSEQAFITNMTAFILNPEEEKAIMYGAVTKFGLMPATGLDEKTIREVVEYIYHNKLDEPAWMSQEMQNRGMK